MKDLFGNEVTAAEIAKGSRTDERASERAHRILCQEYGITEGRKCKDCAFLRWKSYAKTYPKCTFSGLDSCTRNTDWSSRWQACGKFVEEVKEQS